jgi:hypothetical protein
MKTRYGFSIVAAMVTISTLLACSITQILPSKTNSPLKSPTGESSEESLKPTDESSQESQEPTEESTEISQEPIVGTWKQIPFQGVGGKSNLGLGGLGIWFGDYFYVGTYNMIMPVPVEPASPSGGGQVAPPGGPGSAGSGQTSPVLATQPPAGPRGAEIWRTLDGINWEVVGEPGLGYPEISTFQPIFFQDRVFVFSGAKPSLLVSNDGETFELINGEWSNGDIKNMLQNYIIEDALLVSGISSQNGLQAWLSTDGKGFDKVIEDSLGNLANKQMCATTTESFNGWYYLGVRNEVNGGGLWRTKNGRTLEKSLEAGFDDSANVMLCSSLIHSGYLYVTIPGYPNHDPKRGVEVIRTADGENWEKVIENGFGLGEEQGYSGRFSVYEDVIYFILSNFPPQSGGSPSTGFRLLKSLDGKIWEQVGEPGFGNTNNYQVTSYIIRDVYYLVTNNIKEGNQIWRSNDGTNWELFHTFPASGTNYGHYLAELVDGLEYFEFDTSRGIQIWRYGP